MSGTQTKKKITFLWAMAFLALILVGFYFGEYIPNQPQYIVSHAASDMLTAKQVPYMQLQSTVISGKDTAALSLSYEGTQSATGALNLAVKATSPAVATFTLQSTDGKKFFIKGAGLENIPKLFPGDASLAPLAHAKADHWYNLDHNLLASSMKNPLNLWQLHFKDGDAKKYRDAYSGNEFFVVDQVLSPENIANRQTEHYRVSIDGKKFDAFVKAFTASKPTDAATLTILQSIHPDGKAFEVWVATVEDSKAIIQVATPNVSGQSYAKLVSTHGRAPVITEPKDEKTLAQLQKEYDDEVAAEKAAKEKEAAAQASASSSSNTSSSSSTSSPGFDTWAQEYNFQNYILPNLW